MLSVFAHYRSYHPRAHARPERALREWNLITARLAEGYSVDDINSAIDGCHRCPHNLGDNERGQKYLSLELICRTGSQVNRFMEIAQSSDCAPLSEKTRRTLAGRAAYVQSRQNGESHGVQ